MPRRACLFIASSAFVAVAAAQTRVPVALPELVGCGKAQAMARSWQAMPAERSAAPEGAQREALAETDLLHCDLQLEVIPTQFNNIYGTNTMTIASRVPGLTQFTFRLADQYTITSAVLNGFTAATVTPVEPHTWVVALDRPYALDEQFTLTISYYGHAASDGFGSIEFSSHSGTPIVYSLSEPYYSFTWWPVKDGALDQPGDNSDKFTLDLSLITPSTLSAASNGLLDSVDTLPGARKRYNWSTGYPLSAYLACFSATNYNSWSLEYEPLAGGTMPILFYIYPEYDTQVNRAAWNLALPMMYTLRDLFGEYPFVDEKYGIYQCQFGGGMEHQTFTAQGTFSEAVTVHELGHQWWGDLVTCKTWNHIWLNEGFATYTEALWAEFKPGGSPAAMRAVMAAKKYTGSGSVFVYTDELGSLYEIFNGSTTYNKGGWVLHMLRHVLGDADFFAALAAYRAQYAFDAATTEDFQAVCEQFYGGTLEWFFDPWIYQQGAPSYTFGWQNTQINGQNYLLLYVNQTQSGSYPRFTMPIDIWVNGTVHKIMNFADPQHYLIPLEAPASTVQFDPEAWVLWASANSTSYVAGPPKIVSTNPPPGAVLPVDTAPQVLAVTFHTGVNTSAAHYTLTGAAHGVLPFTFAYNAADKTATLTFAAPLPPDTYTLTVDDALTAQNSGQALDGEIAAAADPNALPSGDGVPGGNAVLLFEVGGLRGDLNCDGDVNFSDINPFVLLISNLEAWQAAYPDCPAGLGDINEDGVLSLRDINPFIALLSGS